MDDSDQDFVDLCSKLLKRKRRRPGEPRLAGKAEHQPRSQARDGDKWRRNDRREGDSGSKCAGTQPLCTAAEEADQCGVRGGIGHGAGDAGLSDVSAATGQRAERGLVAKDKVLLRMQQFKRASPQRMVHKDKSQPTHNNAESFSADLHRDPKDSDEALALRLQQQLDSEAAEAQMVDLEDGGLFFCPICHRDLSHMSPEGRTQHLNRCLDKSEEGAPPPPPPPGIPDCPICGKKFKSQKSRSAHLKRCSSDMGVSPAVLLQAVQRQTEETQNAPAANTLTQTGGAKRKGPSKPVLPARKKPRTKTEPLDDDTLVALALSSSLQEQEREQRRERESERPLQTHAGLKWRPDAGKGRGRRRKGTAPRPPPLLLLQDAAAALTRLQERVSALLLRSRAPSPPTPTRCPSSLPGRSGAAPLWHKSTLLDGGSTRLPDFYTPELREFITPWELATTDAACCSTANTPGTSVQPASEGAPVTGARASVPPSSCLTAAPPTPGTGQLPVGSQALRDLMELAEDGMTPTQCGYSASGHDKVVSGSQITNPRLSGFVPVESEEQAELCVSGFLLEATHTPSDDTHSRARRTRDRPDIERGCQRPVALCRLASDLRGMVNNPQLSDVQLQVDSGDVYFAHSFMVYARCPLLAEMVHESGFGVKEGGTPAAQRVLVSDVPGQAVFALLQYLYTAQCSVPASLRPHVLELASRFDLQELQQLCDLHRDDAATQEDEEDEDQTDQAFVELLRSMWNEEGEEDEGTDTDRGGDEENLDEDCQGDDLASGEREIREEKVNEEELEEIYEFAATQRKREDERDSVEDEEEGAVDEERDGEEVFARLTEPERSVKNLLPNSQLEPDPTLDRSYNRLFSDSLGVCEEGDPSSLPSTSCAAKSRSAQSQQHQSPEPSSELPGRTLLQSLASVVDDFALSPPPSTSNLPVPGQSPGDVEDRGTASVEVDVSKEGRPFKRESQGPRSICVPFSPQKKKEPELIVLSDSSEEMEVVLSSRSPSPRSPCAVQNLQGCYTQIKAQPVPKPNEPKLVNKKSSSLALSPDDPSAAALQSYPEDCSPEVSWLIPSTPLQHRRSTTTSCSQTKSSMSRTQLFPKGDSSSSSSVFSSPALLSTDRLQTSNCPTRVSSHAGPEEGSVPRSKLDETVPCSSGLELNFCSKRSSSCDVSKDREVSTIPPCQPKFSLPSSLTSSKQDTPLHLHLQPKPYSSTPLHTQLHQLPGLLATSPLHTDLDKQWSPSQEGDGAPSESPEKMELGSFHLSPLSDPSDAPCSSSYKGLQISQGHSDSSRQSRRSVESSSTGGELTRRGVRHEEGVGRNKAAYGEGEVEEAKAESGEADATEFSFQQSFMDEPPIAFNDSWGLDACVEAKPGCFSLRLEDSRGSSQQERETACSSSSGDCPPSPSSHGIRSPKSRGAGTNSPLSTSVQAHTGPTFTPPPPDPTTRTTPEINNSLLDSKIWDSWEEEEEAALPLSQRINPSTQLKTPASSHNKRRLSLVPITPMAHYSDMDTPELKSKLNRFGVRPLPKRQMILKLKEIHQYTHQLASSDSDDEAPSAGRTAEVAAGNGPTSCAQKVTFREPWTPTAVSPLKHNLEEEEEEKEAEVLSASQGSNTSSTAASEESERSNPEQVLSSDGDSDSDAGISASQVASRLQDRIQAVRSFILSDSRLYTQILQYQPLVLSQLQARLKGAGIRLGAAKLVDYLDSQCITFTTAKPGHSAPSRRRGKKAGQGAKAAGRKRGVTAVN